jgi:hypothetical protein
MEHLNNEKTLAMQFIFAVENVTKETVFLSASLLIVLKQLFSPG